MCRWTNTTEHDARHCPLSLLQPTAHIETFLQFKISLSLLRMRAIGSLQLELFASGSWRPRSARVTHAELR